MGLFNRKQSEDLAKAFHSKKAVKPFDTDLPDEVAKDLDRLLRKDVMPTKEPSTLRQVYVELQEGKSVPEIARARGQANSANTKMYETALLILFQKLEPRKDWHESVRALNLRAKFWVEDANLSDMTKDYLQPFANQTLHTPKTGPFMPKTGIEVPASAPTTGRSDSPLPVLKLSPSVLPPSLGGTEGSGRTNG